MKRLIDRTNESNKSTMNRDFLYVAPAQSLRRRRIWEMEQEDRRRRHEADQQQEQQRSRPFDSALSSSSSSSSSSKGASLAMLGSRAGLPAFLESLQRERGFRLVSARVAPSAYVANPLASGDATLGFLHFNELEALPYMLYHFRKAAPTQLVASASGGVGGGDQGSGSGCPRGHTPFSWAAKNESRPPPLGHTPFSWPSL